MDFVLVSFFLSDYTSITLFSYSLTKYHPRLIIPVNSYLWGAPLSKYRDVRETSYQRDLDNINRRYHLYNFYIKLFLLFKFYFLFIYFDFFIF